MLAPYLKRFRRALFLALGLNAFQGLAITFQTLVPKYLIDNILLATGISAGVRWQRLFLLVGLYLFASIFCRMLLWHASYRIFTRVREGVILGLREKFFRHINHLCVRFHGHHDSGELFSYLFGSPLVQVQQYFQQMAMAGVGSVFTLVSSILWVWSWDPLMTLLLVSAVGSSVVIMEAARRRMRTIQKEFQAIEGNVSGHVADLIRGHREIKLSAMEAQVVDQFHMQAGLIGRKSVERDVHSHVQFMKSESANYFFFSALCLAGTWRYFQGFITIGEVQGYLASFIALQAPVNTLLQISVLRGGAQASLERLNAVLDTVSTTPDPPEPFVVGIPRSEIQIRDLHFAYAKRPTLAGIDLLIPYGQRIALVGPSGAGKTTLAQLLLRLYLPDRGEIRVGGHDIRKFRGSDLRRIFGVVPQSPYFFRTTLRDNLRLLRPAATDEELRAVCEKANAWEFIREMPAGLDTSVGEAGHSLSGGQRQRLAIARALLHSPDYFIFDEATSALDNVSERLIQDSLSHVLQGRTALFIAHRLATVRTCDRIVVLEKGRIIQDGTYRDLVDRPGLFRQMVESDELAR